MTLSSDFKKNQTLFEDLAFYQQEILHFLLSTLSGLTQESVQHPEKLASIHLEYWQANLMNILEFQTTVCYQYLNVNFFQTCLTSLETSHELFKTYVHQLITLVDLNNHAIARKMNFMLRQWVDALAPRNFFFANPEIILTTLKTEGKNLLTGIEELWQDLLQGNGNQLFTHTTDMQAFHLGKNLAITPGKVIYQNEVMELIEYTPSTHTVYKTPILIFPPWINKYYILDLRPENSLVKFLVDQGFPVFMVSWVNASRKHRHLEFQDYLQQGALKALEIVQKIRPRQKTHVMGYCIGGTLLACLLSYLKTKKKNIIASATFLTTLLDFSEPGDLGVFIDDTQLALLETRMKMKGYLDGQWLATVFSLLRPKDLIWPSLVNHYLKGEKPRAFDLLYWNADPTNIPEKTHRFYLREMYLNNHLVQAGKIQLAGVPIDLGKITLPTYYMAAENDHIALWKSCYQSAQHLGVAPRFVLAEAGHVAGVVNPPNRQKYGYYASENFPKTPETFQKNARYHSESWWIDWTKWLISHSPLKKISPPDSRALFPELCKAPGTYVKKSIHARSFS